VSEFRIEKRRAEAHLTLTGGTVSGCFFLSGSNASHSGPERVADLLNGDAAFFPFEVRAADGGRSTALFNRAHLLLVTLVGDTVEAQLDPGYNVAPERAVRLRLSNGQTIDGRVRIYCPHGRDRLSDYARAPELFRYVETAGGTVIVNAQQIVELRETTEA